MLCLANARGMAARGNAAQELVKGVMRGLVDCWTVWIPSIMLYCSVWVPPGRGDSFVCFCALFRLPNLG